MLKLGISSLGLILDLIWSEKPKKLLELFLNSTEESLKLAENERLKVCEIMLDFPILSSEENKKKFIELCESYSIEKQIHGPFIDVSLCSHNDKISQASIDSYIESAIICKEIGTKILTIHPGLANLVVNSINQFNTRRLIGSVKEILKATEDLGVKICIENMQKSLNILLKTEDFNNFFSHFNRDDLYITYDTAHYWTNADDPTSFWKTFHNKIKNVHLVDNNTKDRDPHIALGKGNINFDLIFSLIKSYKYEGALIVELNSKMALIKGINYVRNKLINF